jgi:hypothetical protein
MLHNLPCLPKATDAEPPLSYPDSAPRSSTLPLLSSREMKMQASLKRRVGDRG